MADTIDCDPAALAKAGACYCYRNETVEAAVTIYLLAQIAGDTSSPAELAGKSACYCYDAKTAQAVIAYLLCQNANGGGGYSLLDDPGPVDITLEGSEEITGDAVFYLTEDYGDYGINLSFLPNVTSLSFPALQIATVSFVITQLVMVTAVSAPVLTSAQYLEIDYNTLLTSINLPLLVTAGSLFLNSNPSLTTLALPALVPTDGASYDFHDDGLDADSIEALLHQLVLAGVTTCTIDFSGGTNAGLASLSVAGQADAATLGAQLTINA